MCNAFGAGAGPDPSLFRPFAVTHGCDADEEASVWMSLPRPARSRCLHFQRTSALMRAHSAALDTVVIAIACMHWSSR